MAPAATLTDSVCPKVPVGVVEKPPPAVLVESETERPPVGAGEVRLTVMADDACPAERLCGEVANESVVPSTPWPSFQLPNPVHRL